MFKDIGFLDVCFVSAIAVCLGAFIAGHFMGKPFPEMVEMIKYFGLAVGIGAAAMAKAANKG